MLNLTTDTEMLIYTCGGDNGNEGPHHLTVGDRMRNTGPESGRLSRIHHVISRSISLKGRAPPHFCG
ncbi:hypothetical protein Y032_0322g2455 [Ancylostoma ceylanicum]|uniref:Uncharacterized protein n=1 Tax=Ancylostoma ceylanicum TaxID=53326 RepID=A0A016S117_9BILA|nr:hypothetical protein Y032_0322g2455 [Ancylostoma ceylanicum]